MYSLQVYLAKLLPQRYNPQFWFLCGHYTLGSSQLWDLGGFFLQNYKKKNNFLTLKQLYHSTAWKQFHLPYFY